jgi:PAS domain S-box-containing protein
MNSDAIQQQRIHDLEKLLEQAERKSDILTNLLKEASSELMQALDKVSQSEANFRTIIENAPEAIYMFDVNTRCILDCNPYTTEWLGYSRKELIGMGVEEILAPDSKGVDDNIRKALNDGYVRIQERRFRTKYGALVDAEVTGTMVEFQGLKCFIALVRDITERKKIEALLRYKELFQNVIDPVFISHSQGTFLEVNDVACERLEYTHKELLKLTFRDIVRPAHYALLSRMAMKIRSGDAVHFEVEAVTKTGKLIPFEFHSRFIEFQHKPAILSVARDLSARKQMENTLIRTERLSAVGEMAAGVAHNFNNLLQMILGAGETAMAKMAGGEIRKSREVLLSLIEACQRGADIVRRIKDFSSAKNDRIEEARVFDLGELVSEAVQLTKPLWVNPGQQHKYTFNYIRPMGAMVKGNPSELYEVLVNIIKNALEAMPEGGHLSIIPVIGVGKIKLSISDSGMGIPEENLPRLFQPFFTTKGVQSSGLGLSSSYGIIKKHQGEIAVKSPPGRGTTFTIFLPKAEIPADKKPLAIPSKQDTMLSKIKFLAIDDEKNILKMLELYFEGSSIELTTAKTAQQGLEKIYNNHFDVVLCDYGMDDMNGLQFCKAVKDHAHQTKQPKPPCLLYTGLNQKLNEDDLVRCGVADIVRKPISCAKLQSIIQEIVSKVQREENRPVAGTADRDNSTKCEI